MAPSVIDNPGTGAGIGWTSRHVSIVAIDTGLDSSYDAVIVTASCTITLPSASGISGKMYTIKNNGDNTIVTIATTAAQTVDGATSVELAQRYQSVDVMSDGSNWLIIARV